VVLLLEATTPTRLYNNHYHKKHPYIGDIMLKKIEGWKTYICVILMLVTCGLQHFGIVDAVSFKTIMGILGSLAIASMKSAQDRIEKVARGFSRQLPGEESNE